jgi:hypothetical protein
VRHIPSKYNFHRNGSAEQFESLCATSHYDFRVAREILAQENALSDALSPVDLYELRSSEK